MIINMDALQNSGQEQNDATHAGFGWHMAVYIALGVGAIIGFLFFFFGDRLIAPPTTSQIDVAEDAKIRIDRINEYIENADTKTEEAQLRRALAENTLLLDPAAGHRILRGIALNRSLPREERSLAVQMMGETYFNRTSNSYQYARDYVFVDSPYKEMLSSFDVDRGILIWDGMRNLYEYALRLGDSPVSHYRVALWHVSSGETSDAEQEYQKGNTAHLDFVRSLLPQDRHMGGTSLWLRGTVASELARRSGDPLLFADANTAFDESREFLQRMQTEGENYPAFTVELLWADLRYATSLYYQDPVENAAKIDELLAEIVSYKDYASRFGFTRYLRSVATETSKVPFYADEKNAITELASRNAGFAQMLRELGWTI